MALYANETVMNIRERMLARIESKYDKRVGSIIFNGLAPTAEELALVYEALDYLLDQSFADTAEREYLIRLCAERNIAPYEATKAVVIGSFSPANMELGSGTRFNCGDYYYGVTSKITNIESIIDNADTENYCYYYLECETTGQIPNGTTGRLIPEKSIAGLKSAEILQVVIFGEDEEETEALRKRYYASFGAEAFGGNVADYKNKIRSLNGVAGVKIYPAWNGGSTSRVVITAVGNVVPSLTLVETVQDKVDPEVVNGEFVRGLGYGLAPIGHYVTVMGANAGTIDINTTLSLETGFILENVKKEIEKAIEDYYTELNSDWEYRKNIIVRLSEINARILTIEHVIDVYNTTLNGKEENIIIDRDSLVVMGSFNAITV